MDPKDPQPNEVPVVSSGGIGIAEPIFQAPSPPQEPIPDTIVVPPSAPPGGSSGTSEQSSANPFLPGIAMPTGDGSAPVEVKRKFPRLLIFLGIFILLIIGGFSISRMVSGGEVGSVVSKEVTLNYWSLWENDTVTRQLLADFEAMYPDIKVQYTVQSPKQYRERLQSAINRGEGPDVFRFHNTWLPMLRTQLSTVPPEIMSATEFGTTFFPVINNDLVAGATVYGIPLMIDGLGLYINEELFATAGVTPPTTWTDVINIIPKLTVKNGSAIVTSAIALGTTNNVEHFSDIMAVMLIQNGANLKKPIGPEAEGSLVFYRKFADPSDPLYTWSDGMDNSVSAFAAGRVAMILAPSWRAHEISVINPKLRFHISPIPQLQGNAVAWASYWVEGVSSKSPNQDAAWKFVQYMTSKEGATRLFTQASSTRLFGEPYARIELANTILDDPYLGAFVKQASYARSFPLASRTHDNGINDKLIQYLTDGVNGMTNGGSPTQVLTTVSQGFRQVLSSYGIATDDEPTPAP